MQKPAALPLVRVFAVPGDARRGRIVAGNATFPCALGKGGVSHAKREGDGATPAGMHLPVAGWYRADRISRPVSGVPLRPLRPSDGWCDAPGHRLYNRPVTLPFQARHEAMWRDDHLYDIVIDLGWNARPRVQGRGSAIFLHLARENFGPTEGCIALPRDKARRLLALIGPRTRIVIADKPRPLPKPVPKPVRKRHAGAKASTLRPRKR